MTNLINRIMERYNRPVSTLPFAVFRILFAILLLSILSEVHFFTPIFFDAIEGISRNPFPALLFIYLHALCILCLGLGLFTRTMAVLNYVLTILLTSFFTNSTIGTFNDDLLRIGSFLMIFMPVSRSLSLDAFIERMSGKELAPRTTAWHNYLFTIIVSIGFLYFGSAITKTYSKMWLSGLGIWLPSLMPYNHWNKFHMLFADNYAVCFVINYIVMIFELVFIFLVFDRRFHWILALTGIMMHLVIAIEFPFPKVCLGPIVFYTLLIHDSFWNRLRARLKVKSPTMITFDPGSLRQVVLVRFLQAADFRQRFIVQEMQGQLNVDGQRMDGWDGAQLLLGKMLLLKPLRWLFTIKLFRVLADHVVCDLLQPSAFSRKPQKPFLAYGSKQFYFGCFVLFLALIQTVSLSYHSYSRFNHDEKRRAQYLQRRKSMQDFSLKPSNLGRTLFGINSRGLFLDHSYQGNKNVYSVAWIDRKGKEHWLFFDKQGLCTGWNMNLYWAKYSFSSVCLSNFPANAKELEKATYFWASRNKVSLDSLPMIVYRREYGFPSAYEEGLVQKLLDKPWDVEGRILWKKHVFHYERISGDSAGMPKDSTRVLVTDSLRKELISSF